ncbi:MAG: hypothetical protein WB713_03770 [Methyloceanibacter sp.]
MRATREGAVRAINISHCAMTRWSVISDDMNDDKLAGHSFGVDQRLSVSIVEAKPGQSLWEDDPEKIGAFRWEDDPEKIGSLGYYMVFNVYVPQPDLSRSWKRLMGTMMAGIR